MNFQRVRKIINTEAEVFNISDLRIYSLVLECLDYNKSLADKFMLSSLGGYDEIELERIHRIRNNTNKRVQNQACAF